MSQLGEAVNRYHKLLETEPYRDAGWVKVLREQMQQRKLVVNNRPITPVLRPHFISRRQYINLVKTAETLSSAIGRMQEMAVASPQLMSRLELLPGEKMLASVDPGYQWPSALSLLDSQVNNGHMHVVNPTSDLPLGVVYNELLSEVFFDAPPVKEFRKKYKLEKTGGTKPLVSALLKSWKDFGGKKPPNVALVQFRSVSVTAESHELELLAEILRKAGLAVEVVTPEMLEYRDGMLRSGGFAIDLVYRGVRAHEFLLRYDLQHPLVRAYRDRKICVVNSFRSEVARKKALLGLLTDPAMTGKFPAVERKAIKETIPWTRMVGAAKTTYDDKAIDLPEFILKNRQTLVLRPNDDGAEQPTFEGWASDDASWERALRAAMRNPYVVQERVESTPVSFPVDLYGDVVMRDLTVDVQPHAFLGKVHGVSARIAPAGGGFSTMSGMAPAFVLDVR